MQTLPFQLFNQIIEIYKEKKNKEKEKQFLITKNITVPNVH